MRLMEFLAAQIGTYAKAPGGLGGQCVDLTNLYIGEVYGQPHVYANALQWANARIKGFSWVANQPTNAPPQGSLVIWGPYDPLGIGQYGHIAIAVAADANVLITCDQNWPEGAPVALVVHEYGGVIGWLKPGG